MFLFRMSSPAVPASSRPLPSYEAKVWLSIRLSSFSIVNKVDVKFCPTTESTSSASPTFPFSCRSSSRTTESSKTLWIKFSRLPLTTKRRARSQVNLNFHFKPFSFWLTNEFYSKGSAKMFWSILGHAQSSSFEHKATTYPTIQPTYIVVRLLFL